MARESPNGKREPSPPWRRQRLLNNSQLTKSTPQEAKGKVGSTAANRVVRTRTYGGVGVGRGNPSGYLIWLPRRLGQAI